jgi:serine/threonine protein kinase
MVFVCCATEDEAVGEAVRASLENNRLECFLSDSALEAEPASTSPVSEALREAELFLLILSQQSNRSPQVRQQLESAAHFQLPLLTFRVEAVEPAEDLAYFLWEKNLVDGFDGPLDAHIPGLLQQIKTLSKSKSGEETHATSSGQAHATGSGQAEAFANFRILRKPDGSLHRLGQGGMGVTYKAIDTTLDRPVALKLIGADLLKSNKARQRFLREAKAAAKIAHPNVATVFQFGEEGDAYFYAMEFLEGEDLERYVRSRGALSPRDALLVTHQVAQALEAAQSHQLIHRDIKPGNIMARVSRLGDLEVKLIDFGLARLTDPSDSDAGQITHSQDFVGSPAFASPEQCEMDGSLDTRSDIYSLGVTLWYLLLAKLPFTGSVGQLLIAHAVKAPPWSDLESLPASLVDLLRRMLAKDPNERPQTPAELQEAIEKVIAVLTGQSVTTRVGRSLPTNSSSQSELTFVPDRSAGSGQARASGSGQPSAPRVQPGPLRGGVRPNQSHEYRQVGVGQLLAERYRIVTEIREGIGGRIYMAKDEKATARQPSGVALKVLHPTIAADFTLLTRVENEISAIRAAIDPHLLRFFNFDSEVSTPFLVREWVHGFLLYDLLRWRRACRITEVMKLLQPLPATLDFIADHGLSLVDVSARKIFVSCPADIDSASFSTLGQNIEDWDRCEVKLNPLSLGPLILHNRQLRGNQTLIPSSRILSLTQAETGIRGIKAVRLFGRLIYELLSGHPPTDTGGVSSKYTPLSALNETGNRVLQRACAGSDQSFPDCKDFWKALQDSHDPSRGVTATPYPPPERVITPIVPVSPIGTVKTPPPAPSRSIAVEPTPVQGTAPPPLPPVQSVAPARVDPPRSDRHPIRGATKEKPWENSLGMRFLPVAGVFFCIWDTRLQDFELFVERSGYQIPDKWKEPGFKQGPDHPVVNVSWDDAMAFCNWLTTHDRSLGLLPDRMSYRLPTDAEWSTAAGLGNEAGKTPEQKKGKIKVYPWGLGWPPPPGAGNYCGEETKGGRSSWPVIAGYNDGYARTNPVSAFPANRIGLHDMGGNVWQWCEDWSNASRFRRVLRGASWLNEHPDDLLLSHRRDDTPHSRRDNYGFRVVIG